MRPRILLFSTAYLPHIGGSELALYHIARHLPDYDIDLVTGRLSNQDATMEVIESVRVFRAGGRWSRFTLLLPKLLMPLAMAITALRLTMRYNYQLFHAYQASQAAVAATLVHLVRPKIPLIITLQEGKILQQQSRLTRMIRAFVLRRATALTAISTYLASYGRSITSAPVHILPNGVDLMAMHDARVIRMPHRIVTVSRLVEKNNVGRLLEAFSSVLRHVPDATLVIAGDGPLRSSLEDRASELGCRGSVEFRGMLPHHQLGELLSSAGIFARPSLSEGLGSAFLEAMAAQTPVLASAVGGIPDIVHHGSTGLLCDPLNVDDIARALQNLLEDEALRLRLAEQAYRFVQEYDWSHIAQRMMRVYSSVV